MKDPVVQDDSPVLRQKAKDLSRAELSSPKIVKLIAHMKNVLAKEEFGVAIAAPQVAESVRLFVVAGKVFLADDAEESALTPPDMVCVNPQLTRLSRSKKEMSEGCLSVRHKYGSVLRHEKATLKALDEHGKPFTYHASGLLAQIFQHECDHLEGILYIDKAVMVEFDEDWKEKRSPSKEK